MATTTHAHPQERGARRVDPPELGGPGRTRLQLAAACYVGIAVLVTATVLVAPLLARGVGMPLFVVAMVALVAVMHPRIHITRRN